jgi:hypothetical protein
MLINEGVWVAEIVARWSPPRITAGTAVPQSQQPKFLVWIKQSLLKSSFFWTFACFCGRIGTSFAHVVAGVARLQGKLGAARILANPATLKSSCDKALEQLSQLFLAIVATRLGQPVGQLFYNGPARSFREQTASTRYDLITQEHKDGGRESASASLDGCGLARNGSRRIERWILFDGETGDASPGGVSIERFIRC